MTTLLQRLPSNAGENSPMSRHSRTRLRRRTIAQVGVLVVILASLLDVQTTQRLSAQDAATPSRPTSLTAVAAENLLGLRLNDSELQWRAPGSTSFQILVASDKEKLAAGVGDLWDSGRRAVDASMPEQSTEYCGKALQDDTTAWWKVRVWSSDGATASPYSEPAHWQVGQSVERRAAERRPTHASGGRVEYIDGRHDRAIRFGEGLATLRADDYAALRSRRGITISVWIRPERFSQGWQSIYRKEDGGDRRLLALGQEGPFWGLWFGLGIHGRGYHEFGVPVDSKRLLDNSWHHVAATYDGKRYRLFLDGQKIGEEQRDGSLGQSGSAAAAIGDYGDRKELFHGGLDDLRIYTRGLAESDVTNLAKGELDVASGALAARWTFDGHIDNEATYTPEARHNRIAFLGDTLIANMDRYGYFEAAVTARWPRHSIEFRNIGWPGDDVLGTARAEFGSPSRRAAGDAPRGAGYEELLRHIRQADATTYFLGYGGEVAYHDNSPDGPEVAFSRFRDNYRRLLETLRSGGSQVILLTPPAHEPSGLRLPDPSRHNHHLAKVAAFLRELAAELKLPVVDLYTELRATHPDEPLTENGVHLNERGYRRLATALCRTLGLHGPKTHSALSVSLAEGSAPSVARATLLADYTTRRGRHVELVADRLPAVGLHPSPRITCEGGAPAYRLKIDSRPVLERSRETWATGVALSDGAEHEQCAELRRLIREKNKLHRYRLRPLNKTYIFLFRSHEMGHLAYEMEEFDALVKEKEMQIAKLRRPRSRTYTVEPMEAWRAPRDYPDHEVPRSIPKPDIDAELQAMTVADGFQVNLFAKNPMVANPINLNWDRHHRAWVSMSSTYPHIVPGREPNDRIVILEDTDRDGVADRSTVFAEDLLVPHSVLPVDGGAYVCSATELLFLVDADGDDRSESRRVVFSGFGNADVHHMIHALRWAPWGEIYFNQSIYINSFIETPWGHRRLNGSGIWRLRPETERLEVFARGMVNPWGHTFDRWGQSFGTDGAGGQGPHYVFPDAAFQSAVGADRVLPGLVRGRPKGTAAEIISGRHMPEAWQGSFLENDFRANRTVRYELAEAGSGFRAKLVETVIHSAHRSYRPADIKMGPDGAIYIVDWYNAIIDHGEVDFHHPLRDKSHGRIWRLTAKGRPLVEPPDIAGASIGTLLEHLRAPEEYTRVRARRELPRRDSDEVLQTLERWIGRLDSIAPEFEHHRLEALWLHQSLGRQNLDLLQAVLTSKEPRARAAAVRVVSLWGETDGEAGQTLPVLSIAVDDEHPRVRLEAVNALRLLGTSHPALALEAANVALGALEWPLDRELDYALWLTARELRNGWLPALQAGKPVFDGVTQHLRYALEATGDRRAIEPLVALLRAGEIAATNLPAAFQTIAGLGSSGDLETILNLAMNDPALFVPLARGAAVNSETPPSKSRIVSVLQHESGEVRRAAAQLCARWNVGESREALVELLRTSTSDATRQTAARALAQLGSFETLASHNEARWPSAVRAAAVGAWARSQPREARNAAIDLLRAATGATEAEPVLSAYIDRDGGADILAEALRDTKLSSPIAVAGVRQARASGRDLSPLIQALHRAGSLRTVSTDLSQAERQALLDDAATQGNRERGEVLYRSASLACTTCHQINQHGGQVGPDLTTVGAYMTPASILESMLNPDTTIKQGFETTIVTRKDGSVVAGILQRRTGSATLVRDASSQVLSIPKQDIVNVTHSAVSLMPVGLISSLRRDELIDLLRYLIELGKQ